MGIKLYKTKDSSTIHFPVKILTHNPMFANSHSIALNSLCKRVTQLLKTRFASNPIIMTRQHTFGAMSLNPNLSLRLHPSACVLVLVPVLVFLRSHVLITLHRMACTPLNPKTELLSSNTLLFGTTCRSITDNKLRIHI